MLFKPKFLKYIKVNKLWKTYSQGEGVKVLVIGSGCNKVKGLEDVAELPSPAPDDLPGDESQTGHETGVCSVIRQVAPKAQIYSLDAIGNTLSYYLQAWHKVVDWYPQYKWDFINCSFMSGNTQEYKEPLIKLKQMGAVIVACTGNSSLPSPEYPAAWTRDNLVIAVGACDYKGKEAHFSNRGGDVLLPGVEVQCHWKLPPPKWTYSDGTSFSTPQAAGILSCIKGKIHDLDFSSAKIRLKAWVMGL